MSIKAMTHYLDTCRRGANEKLALIILADYANDEGECYPGHKTLAKRLNMSESGARKVLYRLRDEGELEILQAEGVHTRNGSTNRYRLLDFIKAQGCPAQDRVSQPGHPTLSPTGHPTLSPTGHRSVSSNHQIEPSVSVATPEPTQPSSIPSSKPATPTPSTSTLFDICAWIVGYDPKTKRQTKQAQVLAAATTLEEAGYTLEDLRNWWEKVWKKDYRWTDRHHSRPTVNQLVDEIGKVKSHDPFGKDQPAAEQLPEIDESIWEAAANCGF